MADPQTSETAPAGGGPTGGGPTVVRPTVSDPTGKADKDPDTWVTGDEPMTGAQASYLKTLATDTGREVPEQLTKADASKLIDELRAQSPRASG